LAGDRDEGRRALFTSILLRFLKVGLTSLEAGLRPECTESWSTPPWAGRSKWP
jgi:hypothetical protein